MTTNKTIKAAVFDMDGLLFDTERLFIKLSSSVGEEIGYSFSEEVMHATIGKNREDIKRFMAEIYGKDFPFDRYDICWKKLRDQYIQTKGLPEKPGARQILKKLKEKHIPCALATSSGQATARLYLETAGFTEYFSVILGGNDVERGKPQPDIFLRAAALLGVEPDKCLVFEDSESGIKAGYAAGMKVIHIPDVLYFQEDILSLTFKVFGSLEDIIPELDSLLGGN